MAMIVSLTGELFILHLKDLFNLLKVKEKCSLFQLLREKSFYLISPSCIIHCFMCLLTILLISIRNGPSLLSLIFFKLVLAAVHCILLILLQLSLEMEIHLKKKSYYFIRKSSVLSVSEISFKTK